MTNQLYFVCSQCGEEFTKWQGKCSNCGAWNTLKEFKSQSVSGRTKVKINDENIEITKLTDVKLVNFKRAPVGIFEVDRVLGGGIVPGSIILMSGEPGIGKSTLVMQIAGKIKNTLYISGEESLEQIKMRAERLKINAQNVNLISETNVDGIISTIKKMPTKPDIIIVDSIQTMYSENFPSTAGSIVQVRESALSFLRLAKTENIPIILIGHVTKDGVVAGPKTLEHMVDVVLNIEGDKYQGMRILRAQKNRFGDTSEVGIFEIENTGLKEIKNPSKLFLADLDPKTSGSVVTATIEGARPILIEIQALTTETSFGYPKRTAVGFDLNRLQLIIAILINRAGLNLGSSDVYLNVSGGYKLSEPAADLAVAMAIVSSFKKIPLKQKIVIFGELALSGDIRPISFEDKRTQEAKRLGFSRATYVKNLNQAIKEHINV